MLISMARYVVETGWRVVMNFFFVVGVVWSVGSLTKKVQSFDYLVFSISTITVRPMSLSFSLSFIRRPLVDIVVFCISVILFFSFKVHHRPRLAPREQSQESEKVSDGRPKVQPPLLSAYHYPQEKSESYASPEPLPSEKKPATHPSSSVETIPRPRLEDSPPPPKKKKHEDRPSSSLSTQFRRSPIRNKPAGTAEAPDNPTGTSPPVNRSPRPLRHAAAGVSTNPPPALPAPQPRRFPDRQWPTGSDASRPRLNGARGEAAWTLERQVALAPSTWKPVPHFRDEHAFRPDEDQVRFFAGASTTTGIPVASAPPWLGYAEDDHPEAHDSMDELWQVALAPSTWKPVPHFRDEHAFRPDEDQVRFFAGASTTTGIPVASAPPWLGYAEDDDPEAHDSMDGLWRAITSNRALKKSEKWGTSRGHEPESSSKDTRMKKSETFNEYSSSRALPQRDRSIGAEELGKRADEFIAKMRNDLRLQRQKSEQRYKETINRSTL